MKSAYKKHFSSDIYIILIMVDQLDQPVVELAGRAGLLVLHHRLSCLQERAGVVEQHECGNPTVLVDHK